MATTEMFTVGRQTDLLLQYDLYNNCGLRALHGPQILKGKVCKSLCNKRRNTECVKPHSSVIVGIPAYYMARYSSGCSVGPMMERSWVQVSVTCCRHTVLSKSLAHVIAMCHLLMYSCPVLLCCCRSGIFILLYSVSTFSHIHHTFPPGVTVDKTLLKDLLKLSSHRAPLLVARHRDFVIGLFF